ncbi:MAG: type II CAAX endopeptidase family protein [Chitinophagales bacterium]|nr:CPBP family intramembrane metalloprotease [Bacteroidota bacterium]MCB9044437.1 CPBP family intramembrane metalloprotease [Chitinophagales bacterium]
MIHNTPEQLFTARPNDTTLNKILNFPITRIFICTIAFIAIVFVQEMLGFAGLYVPYGIATYIFQGFSSLLVFVLFMLIFHLYTRLVEERHAVELSTFGAVKETFWGIGIGATLMLVVALVMYLLGNYSVVSSGNYKALWEGLVLFWPAAFLEELLMRALLFKVVEEYLGSIWALVISALMFGILHLTNDNATWFSCMAIALEAGILLGATYMLTRRIWLSQGLHFAWNFVQTAVLGFAVSGNQMNSFLEVEISGSEWITGGSFGAEASIIAIVLCTATGFLVLRKAFLEKQFVLPRWRRKKYVIISEE